MSLTLIQVVAVILLEAESKYHKHGKLFFSDVFLFILHVQ